MLNRRARIAAVALTALSTLVIAPPPASASTALTVAQATTQQQSSNTRYSSRGTRKLIKLGVLGLFGLVAVGGWAVKKVRGEGSSDSR